MKYNIRAEDFDITPSIREYVQKKLDKLQRYFQSDINSDVYVTLKQKRDGYTIEVTIPMTKLLLRAEDKNADLYAATDLVVDKLERQIRKHKTKVNRKFKSDPNMKQYFVHEASEIENQKRDEQNEDSFDIVRTKQFNLKPMDVEEAILQMNLLGHNFFVFNNSENNKVNVVYKRNDGRYGLILTK